MMLPTAEIRWFFPGEIPPAAAAWFAAQVCADAAQPARVDQYLWLDENDALGIKLRQGRMEAKQREGETLPVRLGEQAAGVIESWRKWSFALAEAEASLDVLAEAPERWLGVWKARRWCLFTVGENGRIIPQSGATTLEQGCACELTEVHLTDSPEMWWSLGLEAFGGTAVDRRQRLQDVARHFLTHSAAPALPAEQSYSYPKWLQIVGRQKSEPSV